MCVYGQAPTVHSYLITDSETESICMILGSREDWVVLYTDVTSGLWLLEKQNTTRGKGERVIVWVNIQGVP